MEKSTMCYNKFKNMVLVGEEDSVINLLPKKKMFLVDEEDAE